MSRRATSAARTPPLRSGKAFVLFAALIVGNRPRRNRLEQLLASAPRPRQCGRALDPVATPGTPSKTPVLDCAAAALTV